MITHADLIGSEAAAPTAIMVDKGYDSDAICSGLESRGIEPVIPTKSNCKVQRPVCSAKQDTKFHQIIFQKTQILTQTSENI